MGRGDATCAVCAASFSGLEVLAEHLVSEAGRSDDAHVMWLNRNVTKHRVTAGELVGLLIQRAEGCQTNEDRVRR